MKQIEKQGVPYAITSASGRHITVTPGSEQGTERIEVRSSAGDLEVSILMTPEGPRLTIRALDIELDAARSLRMRCENLEVDVGKDAALRVGGHLTQQSGGNSVLESAGLLTLQGADLSILAPQGGIALKANDDLDLKGERILLNTEAQPMAASWKEFNERIELLEPINGRDGLADHK